MITNEDWEVTTSIYSEEAIIREGVIDIPISLSNIIGIRRVDLNNHNSNEAINPEYEYCVLSEMIDSSTPIVRLEFQYRREDDDGDDEHILESVEVSFQRYPNSWCSPEVRVPWLDWLSKHGTDILLETRLSFSVCEYVEHEGMNFFDALHKNEADGLNFIMFQNSIGIPWPGSKLIFNVRETKSDASGNTMKKKRNDLAERNRKIETTIRREWKSWVEYTCPICFCSELLRDAIELPSCRHSFCKECLSMYFKSKLSELQLYRTNPFLCPVVSCKCEIQVLEDDKGSIVDTDVGDLLTDEDFTTMKAWRENIDHPPCNMLTTCPMKKCRAKDMRRVNVKAGAVDDCLVFCNVCGKTFCELCLLKIVGLHQCDEREVLKLCRKYSRASDEIKKKCDDRWHWLKDYASAREFDLSAKLWVNENASRCPNCSIPIERIEGCFHMHCTECGTHYCYECGEELHGTSYYDGTHNCQDEYTDFDDFYGRNLLFG